MNEQKPVATGKTAPVASAPAASGSEQSKTTAPAETTAAVQQNGSKPLIDLEEAMGILATSKSRSSGGAKIRANVGYTLVADKMKSLSNTSVPEQEQVIVKILLRALTTQKPVISEPELNKLVLAAHNSGALKTKQDAWHIFRYYRTDLIKRGVLKQVEIAA